MTTRDPANGIILAIAAALSIIWTAGAAYSAERETSTDRPGLDFRDFALTTPLPDQCEAACNKEAKCRSWTFAWPGKKGPRAHCFLKTGLPPKKADNCCISGIKTKQTVATSPEPAPEPPQPQPVEPPPQEPAIDIACREYAETAIKQNRKNEELLCELTGARWGHKYDVYFNWCMKKSTQNSRIGNTEARNRELTECGAFIGLPEIEPAEPKDVVRENACREYANRSVEQAEQAHELDCGYTGPRWVTAFQQHFSWCMSVAQAYPGREISQRRAALENCRPELSLDAGCEQYAHAAFRLARQNRERRCGFVGPRWVRNIDTHKSWCIQASPTVRNREQIARHQALAACSGGPKVIGACGRYAKGAVKLAIDNRQRDCGFSGTRWQLDYERHFIWCMNATPPQRFKERRSRLRAMLKCSRGEFLEGNESQFLYRYRWKTPPRASAGWNSGWIRSGSRAVCEHKVNGCRCGWQNYCSTYRTGEFALWWRDGCDRQPEQIVCEVRKR